MYSYSLFQWILFFFIYCFLGWCCESTIVSFHQKHFVNRGFLHAPLLPIYGFGALSILISTLPVKNNAVLVYIFGMIGATILEYVTGWAMEKIFKIRYWDYTGKFLNLNGHICLECSLFWGFLSIFMTYIIHKPIEKFVVNMPKSILYIITSVLLFVFAVDFVISLKAAIDLAKYLSKIYTMKEELDGLIYMKLEEANEVIKEKADIIKTEISEEIHTQGVNKVKELDVRIAVAQEQYEEMLDKLGYMKKRILKSFPQATSHKCEGSIEAIREHFRNKIIEIKEKIDD